MQRNATVSDNGAPASVRPPYATESSIRGFFGRMQRMGEPGEIDAKWVQDYDLGGSQAHAIVGLLKWLGVIDGAGKSSGVWNELRTDQAKTLDQLVRTAYAPIFDAVDVGAADRRMIES